MKDRLIIIGAGVFQVPLILKAKEMGLETHVFAWADGAVGAEYADYFYPVSITEKEEILEKCREIKPIGITSIGSDLAVVTVNYVAEQLGLAGNPTETTARCTNKYAMRQAFMKADIPTPRFSKVESADELDLQSYTFPIIVKPTDRSGSRCITKLETEDGLRAAVEEAAAVSFEKKAIVEEYIEGNEYSCECISYNGHHHFLAFTKKYTTGAPHFIETGHMEPSDIPAELQEQTKKAIFDALTALGIKNGASHTEFKLNEDGRFGIIEIGARMGGDCIGSDLVYLSTGYDFIKMVIDVACGREPGLVRDRIPRRAKICFIMNEDDLKIMEREKDSLDIWRISDIEYENLGKVTDSSTRLGYYIWCEEEV